MLHFPYSEISDPACSVYYLAISNFSNLIAIQLIVLSATYVYVHITTDT